MKPPAMRMRALVAAAWLLLLINGTGLAAIVLFPTGTFP